LPLGLLFAGMTIVTGSIWPAIIAHGTLNIFPMALLPSG
jgi:membrane protease YdiL (CAAX protease family)